MSEHVGKKWSWFTGKFICARFYVNINQASLSALSLWVSSPSDPPEVYEWSSWLFVPGPLRFFSPVLDSPPSPRLHWACSLDLWWMWAVHTSGPNRGKDKYHSLNHTHLSTTVSVQSGPWRSKCLGQSWADTQYSQHQAQGPSLGQAGMSPLTGSFQADLSLLPLAKM